MPVARGAGWAPTGTGGNVGSDALAPAWGGHLDNRLRFGMEVLAAVRREVGAEFIVGFRMVADEQQDGGLSQEDGLEIARRLAATGQVDFSPGAAGAGRGAPAHG